MYVSVRWGHGGSRIGMSEDGDPFVIVFYDFYHNTLLYFEIRNGCTRAHSPKNDKMTIAHTLFHRYSFCKQSN